MCPRLYKTGLLIPAKSDHLFSAESPVIPFFQPTDLNTIHINLASQLVLLGFPLFDPVYHDCFAKY